MNSAGGLPWNAPTAAIADGEALLEMEDEFGVGVPVGIIAKRRTVIVVPGAETPH